MRIALFFLPALLIVAGWTLFSRGEPTELPENPGPPRPLPDAPPAPPTPGGTTARQLAFAVSDRTGFARMERPKPGEWLAEHPEAGQNYEEYIRSRPIRATAEAHSLAFLPVGEFSVAQQAVADATFRFAGIWYDLPVTVQKRIDLPVPVEGFQRVRRFTFLRAPVTQYHTDWFLNRLLPARLPESAVMLAAITTGDLYPDDGWNYVFGIASLRRRVGVYSIARYFPGFWGRKATEDSQQVALRRAVKLVTHELGHCFGLLHCIEFECGMNGSNSLEESEGRPIFFCPVCLRKLQWNRGFDILGRYDRLRKFFEAEGLDPEARWTKDRMARISAVR